MSLEWLAGWGRPGRAMVFSFGRDGGFRHFKKLTLRDFARGRPHGIVPRSRVPFVTTIDCAGTELLIRLFKKDLKEDRHGKSSMEAAGLTDRPQGTAQGKSRV
ncbi:hypothetical protein BwSF19_61570 [Bradyrhizobium ottawaense]|nr:hypothetical protein BwSG20_76600 [Bradyrhizobium ottawaense]GMO90277.1 hypothetical protein BwSF19_61570 [Bradyrhizobium ottawaense]